MARSTSENARRDHHWRRLARIEQHHGVLWKESSADWKRRSDSRNSLHKTETLVVAAANGISYRSADVVGPTNQMLKMAN
jgi:hypothetical protein